MAVNIVAKEFREFFNEEPTLITSAPSRLDFLNTHQDYKGLPVVAVGINLRTYIAISRSQDEFVVASGNLRDDNVKYVDKFSLSELKLLGGKWFGDYIRALIMAFMRHGYSINPFKAWIRSNVPIASGLGSSGTLLVALASAINAINGFNLDRRAIAEIAYEAEHDVMGIPCGRLDQYAAAFGDIVVIETKPPYNVEVLPRLNGVFLVVDTGIRHSTADIHPKRQQEIDEGLNKLLSMDISGSLRKKLGAHYWEVHWDEIREDEISRFIEGLSDVPRRRILYTLRANESTKIALKVIKGEAVDIKDLMRTLNLSNAEVDSLISRYDWREALIGRVMTYQHRLLSEYYDVSLPIIDELVNFLVNEGVYGAKLSGAGLGGSVIALVRDEAMAREILNKVLGRGLAPRGWVVSIDGGVMVHG
ncbi:galactokinase [Vulcanisaeta distributa]|uniref:GHMP kinase n=1 Tax=Vulcanisaeta distributa (strain DSM 14429 / JCM 11212 / NBRC 100878 / IC-017) TaxID=572478 RepID=E1QPS4_VULDI|nr:galactokinase family protein [Vulcanisaeta distributa]ADN51484.1 GHMP kinase [Vulcanisaeta distributa DSM 14429]